MVYNLHHPIKVFPISILHQNLIHLAIHNYISINSKFHRHFQFQIRPKPELKISSSAPNLHSTTHAAIVCRIYCENGFMTWRFLFSWFFHLPLLFTYSKCHTKKQSQMPKPSQPLFQNIKPIYNPKCPLGKLYQDHQT